MKREVTIAELKSKSLSGVATLIRIQIIIKVLFVIGNIILARILAPEVFGIYVIITFVVQCYSTFADVGIGAALIQKKDDLKQEEISTAFWLQQGLVSFVIGVVFFSAPLAQKLYPTLSDGGIFLIRIMALSLFFASLKSVPVTLMERNLDFHYIVRIDIVENVVFYVMAVALALLGFEVWSLVLAFLLKGLSGTVVVYSITKWKPNLHFSFSSIKGLITFGASYQAKNIFAFIKDAVTPLFVGIYAGPLSVGYLQWARTFAFASLFVAESYERVSFPAFSRIQQDNALLKVSVEQSIRMMTLVLFPLTALMVSLGQDITRVVFTEKWMPGLNAFYLYCFSPLGIGVFLPLYSAILSMGKPRILWILTLAMILGEWGLGVPFVLKFGFIGVAMTQPIMVISFTYIYFSVLKAHGVTINIFGNILHQLISAILLCGIVIIVVKSYGPINIISIILLLIVGIASYSFLLFIWNRSLIYEFISYIKTLIYKSSS